MHVNVVVFQLGLHMRKNLIFIIALKTFVVFGIVLTC
jgi:hypothetical protein